MTYEEIKKLVKDNNLSKEFSDEFVICLIWKETNFEPTATNSETITGLMQMSEGAVESVNRCTPVGIHFEHSDMTDPAKNIQCGTIYLDIAKNKLGGVDTAFGTGKGYSKSIITCEECLKKNVSHPMVCLHKIHK